jgi:hypothetical protein
MAARVTRNLMCRSCRGSVPLEAAGPLSVYYTMTNQTISLQDLLPPFLNDLIVSYGYCNTCNHTQERIISTSTLCPGMDALPILLSERSDGMTWASRGNLTIPQRLNLTGLSGCERINRPLYRLSAIVRGRFDSTAILRVGNDWFSTNGTGLTPTDQPEEDIIVADFEKTLALYETVDSF